MPPSVDGLPHDLVLQLPPGTLEAIVQTVTARVTAALPQAEEGWPEWMPLDVAARYLGCTVAAARKLYERRRVPHYQEAAGCKVHLRRSELDAYMEAGRSGPAVSNAFPHRRDAA